MRKIQVTIITALLILFYSCKNGNQDKAPEAIPAKTRTSSSSSNEKNQPSGTGIAGSWMLQKETFDDNNNHIIDEDELKKSFGNSYHIVLNEDGSCRLQNIFTGKYSVTGSGGKRILSIQRNRVVGEEDTDPPPDKYEIISQDATEMILLVVEGANENSFWIFRRV
jgi:hypothetical protein